jgi:hypothetical protein
MREIGLSYPFDSFTEIPVPKDGSNSAAVLGGIAAVITAVATLLAIFYPKYNPPNSSAQPPLINVQSGSQNTTPAAQTQQLANAAGAGPAAVPAQPAVVPAQPAVAPAQLAAAPLTGPLEGFWHDTKNQINLHFINSGSQQTLRVFTQDPCEPTQTPVSVNNWDGSDLNIEWSFGQGDPPDTVDLTYANNSLSGTSFIPIGQEVHANVTLVKGKAPCQR